VLIVSVFADALPAALLERAPGRVRCTAVAIDYNLSLGVIGGLTPFAATWLVQRPANWPRPF
jgi:MHS family proline/betaine transporter-like MFS transporter